MTAADVPTLLAAATHPWLAAAKLRDAGRATRNLRDLAALIGADALAAFLPALGRALARNPDPDRALTNLERFLAQPGGRDRHADLIAKRGRLIDSLLHLLGTSQFFADLLVGNPDFIDVLRPPFRRKADADLHRQLAAAVAACDTDAAVLRAFRRFRQRHMLAIGVNDVLRDRPLEEITRDISRVAEASLAVAFGVACRTVAARTGSPRTPAGDPDRATVIAFGKLGGEELNYSSDIDLMFVYDSDGQTDGRRPVGNDEYWAKVVGELVRLLSSNTDRGQAYRIDLRLRPEGQRGPLARTLASTLSYYDRMGRTWERQALIKARPVAGDAALGADFLAAVEPFVYRQYLSFSEINEVKAIKRKIERKVHQAGESDTEVKTGRGGIRDIEFAIQFLQLLNGGDLPALRQHNTLAALNALRSVGSVTDQEFAILDDAYRFLRKLEHRLQLLFDLQTHRLPDAPEEQRKLALRLGYKQRPTVPTAVPVPPLPPSPRAPLDEAERGSPLDAKVLFVDPLDAFLHDYHEKTRLNRTILDHVLHLAFAGDGSPEAPESDLLLDPDPDPATVRAVLGRYPFRDVPAAFANLQRLGQEAVPFLSSRRCRHFLASVAPRLLRAIAETADADLALSNLETVTTSLGAKAVLYELFSFVPASLKLTVDLCANSQFLVEVLTNNPGMIDELLDTLVLNRPRDADELRTELTALLHGASDVALILRSFQDKELLRIGVRDLLGQATVRDTAEALSDLAETILGRIVDMEAAAVRAKHGEPPCRFAVLALGRLGGREMGYHSDLDLIFVYEGDGPAAAVGALEYYTELAQRVVKRAGAAGPLGKLYNVDLRLRPTGASGSLAVALPAFRRYHEGGGAQLWERQALTRARQIGGDAAFAPAIQAAVREAVYSQPWGPACAAEMRAMRAKLEASRGPRNLKRGPGGLTDIEFLVQARLLRHAGERPELRTANVRTALGRFGAAGLIPIDEADDLLAAYDFLRSAESRLRIVTNRALEELPDGLRELDKLARRMGYDPAPPGAAGRFLADYERHTRRVRGLFEREMG